MSLRRGLYHLVKTWERGVGLTERGDVCTKRRLAAEVERLARNGSRTERGIDSGAVDTQQRTMERAIQCAE